MKFDDMDLLSLQSDMIIHERTAYYDLLAFIGECNRIRGGVKLCVSGSLREYFHVGHYDEIDDAIKSCWAVDGKEPTTADEVSDAIDNIIALIAQKNPIRRGNVIPINSAKCK